MSLKYCVMYRIIMGVSVVLSVGKQLERSGRREVVGRSRNETTSWCTTDSTGVRAIRPDGKQKGALDDKSADC